MKFRQTYSCDLWHDLMTLFSLENACIQSLFLPPLCPVWLLRVIPAIVVAIFVLVICTSMMLSGVRKRSDWLTPGPAVCSHWQLYPFHLCSIILSTEVHHNLCQQMQYSTPPAVIRLLNWESPDLIQKGTWALTATPSPLLLPLPLPWTLQWHLRKIIPVPFPLGQELPCPTLL